MAVTATEMVDAARELTLPELETVIARLTAVHASRAVEAGVLTEGDLVREVLHAVPPVLQQRYDHLKARRRADTLTEAEHQEYLHLIDLVEHLDARRLQHLLQLARLRQASVAQVMNDLGIVPPALA